MSAVAKMKRLKRGDVVLRPDKWHPEFPAGSLRQTRAIVMKATAKHVVLCSFHPHKKIDYGNPHVSYYWTTGLKHVGHVKKMPAACVATWERKKDFYDKHPHFKNNPTLLAGSRRKRRR